MMSSSGSEQSFATEACAMLQPGQILAVNWSWQCWFIVQLSIVNCGRWVTSVTRPRHGCSRLLLIGARAGTMFFYECPWIGFNCFDKLIWNWLYHAGGAESLFLGALRSSRDVLCLSWLIRFRSFFIKCLFHMGKLVNMFHMPAAAAKWAMSSRLGKRSSPGGDLEHS